MSIVLIEMESKEFNFNHIVMKKISFKESFLCKCSVLFFVFSFIFY